MVNIQSAVSVVLLLMIGTISLTIVKTTIDNQNFTGTLATITDNIPIFLGLGLLVAAVIGFIVVRGRQ
jgi:hypothetical protein